MTASRLGINFTGSKHAKCSACANAGKLQKCTIICCDEQANRMADPQLAMQVSQHGQ